MKNKYLKPISLLLCALLLIGTASAGVAYALSGDKQEEMTQKELSLVTDESEADLTKDETVYVLAGADGSVQKIIVSDWIKNAVGTTFISDKSELNNVENVKGNETYVMNGDNMRVWNAQGNDIYYQGDIKKELPVDLSVSYALDGKSISPAELAGKSGKITIRFDYTNNQYKPVEIDGKEEKMYVPFAMLTGMLLDADTFTNVEVSNGRLINDGNRIAVVGIAFPGLQSNLNVDAEKFEIPDYVEITADVKNFKLTNTVTIATNEIFSKLNTVELDSVDDLTASLDDLSGAMGQLMDGSSQLYDGLCTLLEKSGELISGVDRLADGALKLKNGSATLNDGASELADGANILANGTSSLKDGTAQLVDGAKTLAGGLDTLASNNDTLNGGAKQVFESLLSMADSQLAAAGLSVPKLTIDDYAQVLNSVIASLDQSSVAAQAEEMARQAVTAGVNGQRDTIQAAVAAAAQEEVTAQVTAAVRGNVEAQVLASMGMTKEEYEAGVVTGTITEEQIAQLIKQNMNSPEVQAQITAALEAASSGAASISALKEQLDSYNQFYIGLNQYTAGVASAKDGAYQLYAGTNQVNDGAVQVYNGSNQLKDGAEKLKAGTAELYAGMSELYDGILTLKNGVPALTDGVTQLRDGAMQLSDGLKEFNEKGVQKLIDAVDGDISGLITRVKATADVSKDYKSFSGLSDDMDGQVKFIYRTEAIETK